MKDSWKWIWDIIRIGGFFAILAYPSTFQEKVKLFEYYIIVIIGDTLRLNKNIIYTILSNILGIFKKK